MPAKLYVVHGSHPCAAVQRALELKGVPYKVVELPPPMHAAVQRLRFGARTVPGLTLESGEKLSGSRAIMRRLEELAPEPPLLPADPDARAAVERAEEWGDEVWQPMARRLLWRTFAMHPRRDDELPGGLAAARCPRPRCARSAPAGHARRAPAQRRARRAPCAPTCARCPATSTASTAGCADGVLGGETVNAADLQIATDLAADAHDRRRAPVLRRPPRRGARDGGCSASGPGPTPPGVFPAEWLARRPRPRERAA